MKQCLIPGCEKPAGHANPFCALHWNSLPNDQRVTISKESILKRGSHTHLEAIHDATRYLESHPVNRSVSVDEPMC